jgi:hypothetical protein
LFRQRYDDFGLGETIWNGKRFCKILREMVGTFVISLKDFQNRKAEENYERNDNFEDNLRKSRRIKGRVVGT